MNTGSTATLARSAGAVAALALCLCAVASAQAPPSLVRVDAVRTEPITQTVPVIGRLVTRRGGVVAARVGGAIERFEVEVGDRLEAGDVVAVLEDVVLRAVRAQAQGRLEEAQARTATAEAQLALARQERDRLAALKSSRATSKALYDDAVQAEIIARARVGEAQAAVRTAEANLRLSEIDLEHARVRAPYAGIIVQRLTEAGAYVRIGEPLVRMIAHAEMEVEADVPYDRLGGLRPGREVRVSLDDGSQHPARVRAIIPEENRLTRTRAVRFAPRFNGEARTLADGQTATVHVPMGEPREVLSVHKDAINRRGEATSVYVVEEGLAKVRPVRLGDAFGNRFEVLSGLAAGDRVVVRGNERLRPDDRVRIDGDA